jgi:hypothetical protein
MKKDWPDPTAVNAAVARSRAALVGLGAFESAEVIRAQRDECNPWVASSELRSIIRGAGADSGLLGDLADVRGGELSD